MKTASNLIAFVLTVGSIFCVGCQTLRNKTDTNFPSNTNKQVATEARVSGKAIPSERKLCIETAKTVASQGHAEEAILLYEKAERIAPKAQPLDLELARLYAEVGNSESAIQRYRNALASDRDNVDLLNNLAWTLMESGQYNESILAVQQGLAIAPTQKRLMATQAMVFYKMGDRERSFDAFRDAHGAAVAHHNLAVMDLEQGNSKLALEQAALATQQKDCPNECIAFHDTLRTKLTASHSDYTIR